MSVSPFTVRGVIEGFYGVYYTFPERNDLIRFIGEHGFNLYVYGPKNDRQHRARWWEPYPDEIMTQFAETTAIAREAGVEFCYATSPISYAGERDFDQIVAKLRSFFDVGVRSFSVLVDDLTPDVPHDDVDATYLSYAHLHVDICNRLCAWLHELDTTCRLSICPVDYHGTAPFSEYLRVLGEGLDPQIDVFYSGPEISSEHISAADAAAYAQVIRRSPIIWDNYPVNDLTLRGSLHLGPVHNRDAALAQVVKGFVVNPMLQPEASKIALVTFEDYFRDPYGYDPHTSWERALRVVGGTANYPALRQFAEHALQSILDPVERSPLVELTNAALAALSQGEQPTSSAAVQALARYLDTLDESCYILKNRMPNLRLRTDLMPWIEVLEDWIWMGKRAVQALERMERGEKYEWPAQLMEQSLKEIGRHTKRIGGSALMPLAEYVREQVARQTQSAPVREDKQQHVPLHHWHGAHG